MGFIEVLLNLVKKAYQIKEDEEVNTNVIERVGLGLGKIGVRVRVRKGLGEGLELVEGYDQHYG